MLTHDALDREEARQSREDYQRSRRRLLQQNEDEDFVWLMQQPQGRRFVARLVEYSGCRRGVFSPNTAQNSWEQGRQAVGFWLTEQGERLCLKSWQLMDKELADGRSNSNI